MGDKGMLVVVLVVMVEAATMLLCEVHLHHRIPRTTMAIFHCFHDNAVG